MGQAVDGHEVGLHANKDSDEFSCPFLNGLLCVRLIDRISQLSVSKSGRTLSRQYSAVSDNPSEESTRGPPAHDPIRASSMWRLMKLNKPEWPYALVGIAGKFSAMHKPICEPCASAISAGKNLHDVCSLHVLFYSWVFFLMVVNCYDCFAFLFHSRRCCLS